MVEERTVDDLPTDQETLANPQEIGWWKQHQVRRALRHYRRGEATLVDLSLVKNKTGTIFSRVAREKMRVLRG